MTKTPRTDAAEKRLNSITDHANPELWMVESDFARQLETENAELLAALIALRKSHYSEGVASLEGLEATEMADAAIAKAKQP